MLQDAVPSRMTAVGSKKTVDALSDPRHGSILSERVEALKSFQSDMSRVLPSSADYGQALGEK